MNNSNNNLQVLIQSQIEELLKTLKSRFESNPKRHEGIIWDSVRAKLEDNPQKLWSINEMERTGGEPDVVGFDKQAHQYIFFDCSPESPKGRRSLCYDQPALTARKEHKPKDSAINMASQMGIELLTEEQYREIQTLGAFDVKSSSWLQTPEAIRKLGGAIYGDRRYDRVFIYHNGADSYYASRGFRGCLKV